MPDLQSHTLDIQDERGLSHSKHSVPNFTRGGKATIDERIEDVFAVLGHEVIDVAEYTTIQGIGSVTGHSSVYGELTYHMFAKALVCCGVSGKGFSLL